MYQPCEDIADDGESQRARILKVLQLQMYLGAIPILRQQKDWVGGWVGSKNAKNMMTLYRDGPLF